MAGLLALTLALPSLAAAAPVTQVQVHITDSRGTTSRLLLDKMSGSMRVVAEQLFNGRDSAALAAAAGDYERLLGEISDRVITGYQTNQVTLRFVDSAQGTTAMADFSVSPWAQTVGKVKVDLQFSGLDTETAALLEHRLPGLEQQLRQTLEGASLDAADWAGSLVRAQVQKQVETALPDFKAAVDVTTRGGDAFVQVIVYPVGPVVRDVQYSMASKSIPNILLMGLKYKYADKAKMSNEDYIRKQMEDPQVAKAMDGKGDLYMDMLEQVNKRLSEILIEESTLLAIPMEERSFEQSMHILELNHKLREFGRFPGAEISKEAADIARKTVPEIILVFISQLAEMVHQCVREGEGPAVRIQPAAGRDPFLP